MFLVSSSDDSQHAYEPLTNSGRSSRDIEGPLSERPRNTSKDSIILRQICNLLLVLAFVLTSVLSFAAGALSTRGIAYLEGSKTAPQIPLPTVQREFVYSSPFSQEPPQGEGSGKESEPIWDALIPDGLGYFKDQRLAPQVSIPTAFHQLHCLYLIRRAYYSRSDDLEEFDFGKDRAVHVAHCFDYLRQGLTCSVDTTVEPAVDEEHGFLGSGFQRQCRDFDTLKKFVAERRVFNASGFLANGLDHGHAHIASS
ncbi:hypothetical protein F5X99DRAFT_405536 [Biscogniauxia marginata]|nr:hypothetical protein F5X99DRAFT_405536 [Biscogniauxia marginata]